ncbi:ABC transporter ATP-binding protein, partial [Klebsiella pneumoniae]|uniref:TOBE domain-containing protein n=1 Tax=Klebsiella pneumoniae TaxID=573 RepID=UPI000FF827EB
AGRIEQVGSPMELYNRPANLFVAGFIGSPQMNFIDAERLGESGYRTLGIRPEHLALSRDTGTWSGKVVHVEHLGADTIVYLESDIIGLLTVRLFGEHAYAPDAVVYASPTGGATHRFGADGNVIR